MTGVNKHDYTCRRRVERKHVKLKINMEFWAV